MKLSILIPTLPQRANHLKLLLAEIERQVGEQVDSTTYIEPSHRMTVRKYKDVEVITCLDNKQYTVGKKRNLLRGMASGEYLTYVDDDDKISGDYFDEILTAIKSGKDLITYRVQMHEKGRVTRNVYYHPRFNKDFDTKASPKRDPELAKAIEGKSKTWATRIKNKWPNTANRIPNHLMVWRRELAKGCEFPDVNIGEDGAWAIKMKARVTNVHEIDKVLYHYMFDENVTETQR